MKIGIVTITGQMFNYGNLLQKYAVQQILKSLGYDSEIIVDLRYSKDYRSILSYYKSLIHYVTRIKYSPASHKRNLSCFWWAKKYITSCPIPIHSQEDEKKLLSRFCSFLVGSDMVWNPYLPWYSSDLAFLSFAPTSQRIAFAPSLGVDHIPDERKEEYRMRLRDFKALSMREKQGATLIEQLTGLKVETLLDPTFLLSTKQWDKFAVNSITTPSKSYILAYILGGITAEYEQYLKSLSKRKNCIVVNLLHDKQWSGGGPSHFIKLIKSAEHVVTDSFHGSVFSLLYHKPLTILNRKDGQDVKSMYVRLDNLKQVFGMTPLCNGDIEEYNLNWTQFETILKIEQARSVSFLKKHLPNL